MRDKGRAVHRLDTAIGCGNDLWGIANIRVGEHFVGGGQTSLQPAGDAGAGFFGVRTLVPHDGQLLQGHLGPPPAISHHCHGALIHPHHCLDAAPGADGSSVKAHQLATKHGAVHDGRVLHAGQLGINAILHLAIDLDRRIHPLHGFAGNGPVLGRLEHNGFDIRRSQLGGSCGHLAETQLAARGAVLDHPLVHPQLSRADVPLCGGRLQQHDAGSGTTLSHIVLRTADATAAAGRHIAPDALAGQVLCRGHSLGDHLRPVALQFFGHQLRQTGVGSLPHLGPCHPHHAGVVWAHHHPGIDLLSASAGRSRTLGRCGQMKAQRQPASRCTSAHHEMAARQTFGHHRRSHAFAPSTGPQTAPQAWSGLRPAMWMTEPTPLPVPAARWMAARTRW